MTVSCQTNRPPVTTMCSFDDGPQHKCVFLPHNTIHARLLLPGSDIQYHDAYFLTDDRFIAYRAQLGRVSS